MKDEAIFRNRLWRLRQLTKSAGGNARTAAILGVRSSYITAMAGPNPNRTIGDKMAAKIEAKFGLEPGELDMPPPKESGDTDPFIAEIVSTLSHVTQDDKEFVLHMSQWIASRSTSRSSSRPGMIDIESVTDALNYDVRDIDKNQIKAQDLPPRNSTMRSTRGKNAGKDKGK